MVLKEMSIFVTEKVGLCDKEMLWTVESFFDDMGDDSSTIFEDEDEDSKPISDGALCNDIDESDVSKEGFTLVIDTDDAVVLPIELSFIVISWHAAIFFESTKAINLL